MSTSGEKKVAIREQKNLTCTRSEAGVFCKRASNTESTKAREYTLGEKIGIGVGSSCGALCSVACLIKMAKKFF